MRDMRNQGGGRGFCIACVAIMRRGGGVRVVEVGTNLQ